MSKTTSEYMSTTLKLDVPEIEQESTDTPDVILKLSPEGFQLYGRGIHASSDHAEFYDRAMKVGLNPEVIDGHVMRLYHNNELFMEIGFYGSVIKDLNVSPVPHYDHDLRVYSALREWVDLKLGLQNAKPKL